jgi:aminoglycoside/choline kinase family phosphotransferase
MIPEREQRRREFLDGAGWGGAKLEPLAADASFRRYFRLRDGGRRAMLMDAPPPREDVRPFLKIARLLARLGFSAPMVFATDPEGGFLILEDLGDDTYTRVIAAGGDEASLYRLATDVLIDLHDRFSPDLAPDLPDYSIDFMLQEAALLTDWFLPAIDPSVRATYLDLWRGLIPGGDGLPRTLVLRDYHIDNLMLVPDRAGLAACGLLDFQDAMLGSVAYDLVSLLEDARRDVSEPVRRAMRARYLAARPGIAGDSLDRALAVLGAQRHAKVIGIFCRLARRDGKPRYLEHLPRLWRLLERSLAHPDLAPLADWFDRHVPADRRGIPARISLGESR